ncbi:MAG: GntR family transcriptional regulator [Gordonia sp. (in: high G+C Gram-positive bacteria)]|uniref:GntR family transcriptional regulator n=1 Tax=Gordonia sp. (in: high G+C Gram-positive bacteria) TaxID=84139 RepID=UPI0039E59C89
MAVQENGTTSGRRHQLSEDVAAYVREMIISGRVRPGDFLRTEPIATAVGVSNTPVREGLLLLAGEGLVELVPRRGFVVNDVSPQDVRDLFWVQATLAAELARRTAERIDDAGITRLRAVVDRHRAALESGDDAGTEHCGHEFHRTVNLAAGSHRLAVLLGSIVKQLPNRFYNEIEGHNRDTMESHPKIIDAFARRDGPLAEELMRAHIMSGADELIGMLAKQGVWKH